MRNHGTIAVNKNKCLDLLFQFWVILDAFNPSLLHVLIFAFGVIVWGRWDTKSKVAAGNVASSVEIMCQVLHSF